MNLRNCLPDPSTLIVFIFLVLIGEVLDSYGLKIKTLRRMSSGELDALTLVVYLVSPWLILSESQLVELMSQGIPEGGQAVTHISASLFWVKGGGAMGSWAF